MITGPRKSQPDDLTLHAPPSPTSHPHCRGAPQQGKSDACQDLFWTPILGPNFYSSHLPATVMVLGGSLRKALRVCSPNTARVYFHGSTEPSPKYIMWSALEMPTLWLGWSLSLSQGLHRPTSMWYGVCQPQRIPFHNVIKVKVIPLICYLFVLMWNMY